MNKASKTKQTMPKSKQTQIAMVDQFPCNRINTNIQSYSVRILKERWDHKSIKVPEFQRNFAYDDIKSIEYFGDHLSSVWNKDGMTITEAIDAAYNEYVPLMTRCTAFAEKMFHDAVRAGGEKYAEICGHSSWECKIGRTDKDPLQRIFGQAGTCYPEPPHIALIMKCSNSLQLESALHNILKLRNRWIENAPGTEWFLTSPGEVESFYHMIVGE